MTDKTNGTTTGATSDAAGERHTAGAFDIRFVIGALLTAYGVILVLMGIFGDTEPEKTGGVNANLWAGLAMLVVGVGFAVWARVRPTVVPAEKARPEDMNPGS